MKRKLLSVLVSLTMGTSSFAFGETCPVNPEKLTEEQRQQLSPACLEEASAESDGISNWVWIGLGTAAVAGVAVAAGGGGGGGSGSSDNGGNTNTGNNGSGNNSNATTYRFSSYANTAATGVNAFSVTGDNKVVVVDRNSSYSGANQTTVSVRGKNANVQVLQGTTTTATANATSMYIAGNDATISVAGTLIADGDDATVIEVEGRNANLTLEQGSQVISRNSADSLEIESANATVVANGNMNVQGWDSQGIGIEGNNVKLTIGNSANISVSSLEGSYRDDDVIATAFNVEGDNIAVTQNSHQFSVGANAIGISVEADIGGTVTQNGTMSASGNNSTAIMLESEGANTTLIATNNGRLNVSNGAIGMSAYGRNAQLINTGNIVVNNRGAALVVGQRAMAINRGTITLQRDAGYAGNDSLTAMKATGNSTLINDSTGVIHLNAAGATPFTSQGQNNSVINRGKIYANGNDVTANYTISNYTVGTQANGTAGTLYVDNASLNNVNIDTAFASGTSEKVVQINNAFVGKNISGENNIQSSSIVWSAQGNKNEQGNVDIVMKKNAYQNVISDASLSEAANKLEQAYTNNSLFNSLNLNSSKQVDQAIRQITGANTGKTMQQARILSQRFNRVAQNAVKSPTGLGFNAVDKNSQSAELGKHSRFEMMALTKSFDLNPEQNIELIYGIARLDSSTDSNTTEGINGGYSQFLGLNYQANWLDLEWNNSLRADIHQFDTQRNIRYGNVYHRAESSNKQTYYELKSTAGKTFALSDDLTVQPLVGLKMRYTHNDAINEYGADDWNLNINAGKESAIDAVIGAAFRFNMESGLKITGSVEGGPNLSYKQTARSASLKGAQGARFSLNNHEQGGTINGIAQIGLAYETDNSSFNLDSYHWQEDGIKDKGFMMNYRYEF